MDLRHIKFRASELGQLMTNGRGKNAGMGKTAQTLVKKVWIAHRYGRTKDITSKEMIKGIQCEEDSIDLYTAVSGDFAAKNEKNFANDWITGTPDIIHSDRVVDIKTAWDIFTFHNKEDIKDYEWQLRAYMMLTDKPQAHIAYCLVSSKPEQVVEQQKRLYYDFDCNEDHPEYIRLSDQVEKLMIYDDIPKKERVRLFDIERDEEKEQAIIQRVQEARELLIKIDEQWAK